MRMHMHQEVCCHCKRARARTHAHTHTFRGARTRAYTHTCTHTHTQPLLRTQGAEVGLEGFKPRELVVLLLSLHRLRLQLLQRPEGVLVQQGVGRRWVHGAAASPEARSMLASHHQLLVAALQVGLNVYVGEYMCVCISTYALLGGVGAASVMLQG